MTYMSRITDPPSYHITVPTYYLDIWIIPVPRDGRCHCLIEQTEGKEATVIDKFKQDHEIQVRQGP